MRFIDYDFLPRALLASAIAVPINCLACNDGTDCYLREARSFTEYSLGANDRQESALGASEENPAQWREKFDDLLRAEDRAAVVQGPVESPSTGMSFVKYVVFDPQHRGAVAAAFAAPVGWNIVAKSALGWTDQPARAHVRAESADGSAWVEFYPSEVVYQHKPRYGCGERDDSYRYDDDFYSPTSAVDFLAGLVEKYRGDRSKIRFGESRTVASLAKKFAHPDVTGKSVALHVRYREEKQEFEEEFYAMYAGPVELSCESGGLGFSYSIGAKLGQLKRAEREAQAIIAAWSVSPNWAVAKWASVSKVVGNDGWERVRDDAGYGCRDCYPGDGEFNESGAPRPNSVKDG